MAIVDKRLEKISGSKLKPIFDPQLIANFQSI
jgi:hypothetical protein